MSSLLLEPLGVQTPRVQLVPHAADNEAPDACLLGRRYGLPPDPWQELVLFGWLGRNEDGTWSSPRCGLAVPRQNGKNGALELRELFGMIVLGERFLHTAHEVKTARKAFLRLLEFFDNERKYPELRALVKEIRRTNGQEAIVLHNGGSVEFVARSKGSGRGFSVDVLVLDEAQELTDDQLEALLATISASPNPQRIVLGTPPGPKSAGEVFTRWRTEGVETDPEHPGRLCWIEWSLDERRTDVDLDDQAEWAAVNPAFGRRLQAQTIFDERDDLTDDGFARERLGLWSRYSKRIVIDPDAWAGLKLEDAVMRDPVVLAIETSPGLSPQTSIGAAGWTSSGRPLIEVVEDRPGTDWVIGRVVELVTRHDPAAVLIDPAGAAGAFIEPLATAGVEVNKMAARDMAAAFGLFHGEATSKRLAHLGEPALAASLKTASTRTLADALSWKRGDTSPALMAVTVARYGLEQHGRTIPPPPPPRVIPAAKRATDTADLQQVGF